MKGLKSYFPVVLSIVQIGLMTGVDAQNKKGKSHYSNSQQKNWTVRIAKIEVDSAYLNEYKTAIEEHTNAALKLEPGVLTLFAMYEKGLPNRVMVVEIYASKEAYQSHIKTPHFLKYKSGTLHMIRSLELLDCDPIAFGAKPNLFESN